MKADPDGIKVVEDPPAYVNGCTVLVTPLEIMINMTVTDGVTEQTMARVFVSPEMAKGIALLIGNAVQKFESDFGATREIGKIFGGKPGSVTRVTHTGKTGVN
jgi:hypothetical protein